MSVRLAHVGVAQQRGVAADLMVIPRLKGLAHDQDWGRASAVPGTAGSAFDRWRRDHSDIVELVGTPEVRVDRPDNDVADDRHHVYPDERYAAPPPDDDA